MAIENKRMQQRVGTYAEFERYKDSLLPNEFASITSGCPDVPDGTALYFKNGVNSPKRLITDEDIQGLDFLEIKRRFYEYINNAIVCLNPNYTSQLFISEAIISDDLSYITSHVLIIGDYAYTSTRAVLGNDFNPSKDGLLIWTGTIPGGRELIPKSAWDFGKYKDIDVIVFNNGSVKAGDIITFISYKKPESAAVTAGESIGLKAGATTAVSGVATPVEDDEEDNDD